LGLGKAFPKIATCLIKYTQTPVPDFERKDVVRQKKIVISPLRSREKTRKKARGN
jgi:hypothetical protein